MTQDENTSPQTPSQHTSRPKQRGKISRYLLASAVACALWHFLYYGIPEKLSFKEDAISPSGKYRMEFYEPKYSFYAYLRISGLFSSWFIIQNWIDMFIRATLIQLMIYLNISFGLKDTNILVKLRDQLHLKRRSSIT